MFAKHPPCGTLLFTSSHLGDSGRKRRTTRKGIPQEATNSSRVTMLGIR